MSKFVTNEEQILEGFNIFNNMVKNVKKQNQNEVKVVIGYGVVTIVGVLIMIL